MYILLSYKKLNIFFEVSLVFKKFHQLSSLASLELVHYAPNIFGVRFKIRLVYRRTRPSNSEMTFLSILLFIRITFVGVELNLQKIIFGVDLTRIPHWLKYKYYVGTT